MTGKDEKLPRKSRRGRPPKHGAFSLICQQEFLEEYPDIRRKVQGAWDGLIQDSLMRFGGKTIDDLPMAVRLSIDRQVSKLAVSQQIEVYLKRHGILRRDQLKRRQVLEPEPILVYWLQLQNSLDKGLIGLQGLSVPRETEVETVHEYVARTYGSGVANEADNSQGEGKGADQGEKGQPGANGEEISGENGQREGENGADE